jgi:hypothetical protein
MRWLGRFSNTQTVRFLWNSQQLGGASVTRATNGTLRIYKDDGLVQRSSSAGITDTEDFDGLTGVHFCEVDLSDNTDANFYNLASFQVVLEGATIGGVSFNIALAHFEITEATDGGVIVDPENPDPGVLPGDTPQVFMTIEETDAGSPADILFQYAESAGGPFSDNANYFGGYKEARILSASLSPRQYNTSTGGIQLTSWRVVLDDTDRELRSLFGITNLQGKKATLYVIDHPERLAEEEPYRICSGIIVNDGCGDNLTYEIEVEGTLGRHSSAALNEKKVPQHILTPEQLPALADRWTDGWPPPLGYGKLSDEDEPTPEGVVPGVYLGDINLQTTFGGSAANIDVLVFGFFGHAIQDTLNIYYNQPDTPDVREVVPFAQYGSNIWAPHKPGWTAATGSSGQYIDFDGYRYTLVFINAAIGDTAQALRDNRIILTGNFNGVEDIGDGTGSLIESPSRIFQHFWTNFVDDEYTTGNWGGLVPLFGHYGVIDHERIEAATAYSNSLLPLVGAMLIGREGRQQTVFEVLTDMCRSWDMDLGENHHGQIVADHEDPAAEATITLNQQDDLIAFKTRRDRQGYANTIRYRFGYRYVAPTAPRATPAEGEPLPTEAVAPFGQWRSGTLELEDATAIALNYGQRVVMELDMYGVHFFDTAAVIAQRVLSRAVGPELTGPIIVEKTTGWQGVGYAISGEDVEIDLNTVIGVTHIEGLGTAGFDGTRVRTRGVLVDPLAGLVTLEGRMLPQLID